MYNIDENLDFYNREILSICRPFVGTKIAKIRTDYSPFGASNLTQCIAICHPTPTWFGLCFNFSSFKQISKEVLAQQVWPSCSKPKSRVSVVLFSSPPTKSFESTRGMRKWTWITFSARLTRDIDTVGVENYKATHHIHQSIVFVIKWNGAGEVGPST